MGEAAALLGRDFVLVDNNRQAFEVMKKTSQSVFERRVFRPDARGCPFILCARMLFCQSCPNTMNRIIDEETRVVASLSELIMDEYVDLETSAWDESPFNWIRSRPSRQKGSIGEKLVSHWCIDRGLDVTRSPDSDADRVIQGKRIEIKLSTLCRISI